MSDLINLERKFALRKDTDELKPISGWDALLKNQAVVILGEPGSGKTSEFNFQCKNLRNQKKTAYFVRLDGLVKEEFQSLISNSEPDNFEEWKNNQDEAYFFLDGADEQRTVGTDFPQALRNLKRSLPSDFHHRAHFFFSSRAQEWTESNNLGALELFLTPSNQDKNSSNRVQVLTFDLLPLENAQITQLTNHFSQNTNTSPTGFFKEIEQRSLWHHFGRPLDAELQWDFWREEKRLGGFIEINEKFVERKCKENDELRKLNISQNTIRSSIEKIALAGVLTNQFSFQKKQEFIQNILKDLTDHKIQEIISLPIFAATSRDDFRFYHRSVQHYLAAKCIASWIEEKRLSKKTFQNLIFEKSIFEQYGERFVPSHLRRTVSWLSLLHADTRKRVTKETPEVLLESGEIELNTFSNEDKSELLECFYKKNKIFSKLLPFLPNNKHASAFAIGNVEPALIEFLKSTEYSNQLQLFALEILKHLPNLHDKTQQFLTKTILDLSKDNVLRRIALSVFRNSGNLVEDFALQLLRHIESATELISPNFAAEVIETVCTHSCTNNNIFTIFRKIQDSDDVSNFSFLKQRIVELFENWDEENRLTLIEGIFQHLTDTTQGSRNNYRNIYILLVKLLAIFLDKHDSTKEFPSIIHSALHYITHIDFLAGGTRGHHAKELNEALKQYPQIRKNLYWKSYDQDSKDSKYSIVWIDKNHHFELDDCDLVWVLEEISHHSDERLNRLYICIDWLTQQGKLSNENLEKLRILSTNNLEIAKILERNSQPPPDITSSYFIDNDNDTDDVETEAVLSKDEIQIISNFFKSGSIFPETELEWNLISHLYESSRKDRFRPFSDVSYSLLEQKYGSGLATQFKSWIKKFWKECKLNLDERFEDDSEVHETITFMLAGLQWDIDDGFEIENASEDFIKKAIMLGLCESLIFPNWFERLIKQKPDLANPIFEQFTQQSFDQRTHGFFLIKLPDASESILKTFAPVLIHHLQNQASHPSKASFYSIQALMRTPLCDEQKSILESLSREQCEASLSQDAEENFVHWWFLLATLSPTDAISTLKITFSTKNNTDSIHSLFTTMGNIIEQQRVFNEPPQFDFLSDIHFLEELLPIFFEHVSLQNDIRINNGEERPAFYREQAEWLRDQLTDRLLSHQDENAPEVIQKLSQNLHMTSVAPQLLRHAMINEVQNNGISPPFTENAATQWIHKLSTPIVNADQLFGAVVAAIQDIELFFQNGDFSFAELIRNQKPSEPLVQPLIASELQHRLPKNISITRESEVIDRNKTDLLITLEGVRVCIEIKIFPTKKEAEIKKSLESQLVSQYMNDPQSNHGIYLICNIPDKSAKISTEGLNKRFQELISCLQNAANSIENKNESVQRLEVLSLNFLHRTSKKPQN